MAYLQNGNHLFLEGDAKGNEVKNFETGEPFSKRFSSVKLKADRKFQPQAYSGYSEIEIFDQRGDRPKWGVLKLALGIIIFVLFMCAGMSFGGDKEKLAGDYTLGEIIVTGEKPEVTAASTIFSIKAEEISNIGATTLTDVLELIPGVSIRVGGQGSPRVDIRGFKTRHVLLLLDGVPINDTYDGQFDPTLFSVGHIAEVKVITGGGSVLYGPGGNGGVINIITKKGIKGVQGSVSGEYGSEESWLAKASIGGGTEKDDIEGFSTQLAFSHHMENPFGFRGWIYRNQLDVLENRYDN